VPVKDLRREGPTCGRYPYVADEEKAGPSIVGKGHAGPAVLLRVGVRHVRAITRVLFLIIRTTGSPLRLRRPLGFAALRGGGGGGGGGGSSLSALARWS